MAHLPQSELLELYQAALAVFGIDYGGEVRRGLFGGVPEAWVAGLPVVAAPNQQLLGDLGRLNSVEILADGVVPLEHWLANAVIFFAQRPNVDRLRPFMSRVSGQATGQPEVSAPPDDSGLRLEAIIGRDETLAFGFLAAGNEAGRAVAKILVPRHEGGQPVELSSGEPRLAKGTGWLAAPDLLITNHHVINARRRDEGDAAPADFALQAAAARLIFDYDEEGMAGTERAVERLEVAVKELDFAVLRLAAPEDRPRLRFRRQAIRAHPRDPFPVNVIQHPRGLPKRIAIRNNLVYETAGDFLRYGTDTDEGSSGAPVFDDAWRVVALHRAARFHRGPGATLPVINEGVLFSAVRRRLEEEGRGDLLDEIDA